MILQKEDARLRQKAEPVPVRDITLPKIKKVIAEMKEAMHAEDDAVGIAAPQIGVSLSIFIVSGKVFAETYKDEKGQIRFREPVPSDLVFINPMLVKKSKKEIAVEEGCLSARWWYGRVKRALKATVSAYDETGKPFTRGGSGLLAQIFQHELDHLEGVLFIDKAKNLRESPPQKNGMDV